MIIYKVYKVYAFAYIIAHTQSKHYNRLYIQVFLDTYIVPASRWVRLEPGPLYESDTPLSDVANKFLYFYFLLYKI